MFLLTEYNFIIKFNDIENTLMYFVLLWYDNNIIMDIILWRR